MIKELDCRKLECPAPVLQTKKLLESNALSQIRILVDNDAAVENLSRFLNFNGFEVSVDSNGIFSSVEGKKDAADAKKLEPDPTTAPIPGSSQKIMVMISGTQIGKGDEKLGEKLMTNFIKTLKEMGEELWQLVFVNHGVKLTTMNSAVLEELQDLETDHINILVCGACLTHLRLMKEKKVGQTTNMLDIVTAMQYADKVINL
ncbi:MAG: sulfurtransferase-like selenium metabolism protein YedF [Desulfobacteraceae bacterium]|nr:sulfurtransferase-like selenium metabolism protein YedF [Desulfobacteraceae bacterium]